MGILAILLANGPPPSYRVELPPGSEEWYQFAAPIALSFAIAAIGLWAARSRSLRTTAGRFLLWVCVGSLAVAYSAWWVWNHRSGRTVQPDLVSWPAVHMPCVWIVFCAVLIALGWRWVRPPRKPDHDATSGNTAEAPAPEP